MTRGFLSQISSFNLDWIFKAKYQISRLSLDGALKPSWKCKPEHCRGLTSVGKVDSEDIGYKCYKTE